MAAQTSAELINYRSGQVKPVLEKLLCGLRAIQKQLLSELQVCPSGSLQTHVNRGRVMYRQVTYKNGKRHRRGITRDTQLLQALARKEFLRSEIDLINQDIELISQVLDHVVDVDTDLLVSQMQSRYPGLSEDYFFDPNHFIGIRPLNDDLQARLQSHQRWASQPFEQSTYKSQNRRIRTSRGLLVRTKSEALICELLYEYGIPFRYEQVLRLESGLLVPDFTFETATGTELYWEHAGMLTDPKYSFRHHLKMMQYESAGIYPWDGLIVTYDINNEINMQLIESVIENQLLPLL